MSWRDRLRTLFVSGEIEENPDEPVEIAVLPIARGPIAVQQLQEAGFTVGGHDAFNIVSNVASGYRVLVPRHQSDAASALLDEILRDE